MLTRDVVGVLRALATRPRLAPAAVRQASRLRRRGWWRRPPFLPLPDRDWMGFRMTTAYGSTDAGVVADDFATWLDWTETMRPAERQRWDVGPTPNPVAPDPGRG